MWNRLEEADEGRMYPLSHEGPYILSLDLEECFGFLEFVQRCRSDHLEGHGILGGGFLILEPCCRFRIHREDFWRERCFCLSFDIVTGHFGDRQS